MLRTCIAALLAGVLGWEREATGKSAGLRTHMLVGVSAALFVVLGGVLVERFDAHPAPLRLDPIHTLSAVATGVSFLGAGTIFVSRGGVQGLTTAASILATAAVGAAVGLERYVLAAGVTLLVLMILRLSRFFDPPPSSEPPPA